MRCRPCADEECLSLQALLEQPYQRRQHASRESLALDGDSSEEEGSQSDHMHATGRSILYQRLEPSACLEAQDASSRCVWHIHGRSATPTQSQFVRVSIVTKAAWLSATGMISPGHQIDLHVAKVGHAR